MKKLLILVFSLTVAGTIYAQELALQFRALTIDMGGVPHGSSDSVTFYYVNVGITPVTLSYVQPSCACVSVKYITGPLMPNDTGFIKTTYKAGYMGAFSESIMITTDVGETARLRINGTVVAPK